MRVENVRFYLERVREESDNLAGHVGEDISPVAQKLDMLSEWLSEITQVIDDLKKGNGGKA